MLLLLVVSAGPCALRTGTGGSGAPELPVLQNNGGEDAMVAVVNPQGSLGPWSGPLLFSVRPRSRAMVLHEGESRPGRNVPGWRRVAPQEPRVPLRCRPESFIYSNGVPFGSSRTITPGPGALPLFWSIVPVLLNAPGSFGVLDHLCSPTVDLGRNRIWSVSNTQRPEGPGFQ